jgi:hypothetical protein
MHFSEKYPEGAEGGILFLHGAQVSGNFGLVSGNFELVSVQRPVQSQWFLGVGF